MEIDPLDLFAGPLCRFVDLVAHGVHRTPRTGWQWLAEEVGPKRRLAPAEPFAAPPCG
jgi:hypothetical protein